jgi:hypothetical protein
MDLYLTDRTGTIVHQLTDAVFSETGPTWAPDGSEIAFVGTYDGVAELWAIQPDGGGLRKIIGQPDVTIPSGPAWSPDGQYIVFSARTDEPTGSEIYLVHADGTGLTRLTYSQGFDYEPKWSPDGRQIAFTTARTGINSLGLMNFDGSDQEVLTQSAFYPTWLPDGSAILYQGYDAGFDLYTYRLDNGTITKLTDTPTLEEGYPAVAPDGSVAIFESLRGDSTLFDLWQIDLSSGELKQLTFSTDDTGAAWRPDPKVIAVIQPLPTLIAAAPTVTAVPPTITPSPTLAPTRTPTAGPTAASVVYMAIGTRPLLIYNNPRQTATAINVTNARLVVLGVTTDGQWYKVQLRDRDGWVLRESTGYRIEGNVNALPLAAPGTTDTDPLSGDPGFLQIMAQSGFDSEIDAITRRGWEIRPFNEESTLCSVGGEESALLTFGSENWRSYEVVVEFQYRTNQAGQFDIITRMQQDGTGIRHRIDASASNVSQFTLRATGQSLGMGEYPVNIRSGQWGVLRAEVDNEKIRTFFDGLQISEYELFEDEYFSGFVGIEASPGSTICLNNITVRSLYRTASAVTDAVPRGEMTANANIRLFPGAGFSRVGAASAGQEVYVMAEAESGEWVYIRVDRPRNPFEGWTIASSVRR